MPSIKQSAVSSWSMPSAASLSKQALVSLAHALVAHGRLSYAELLSPSSVSDVIAVVRQVRDLLSVEHSQWRQWAEEAADSTQGGGMMEQSSELSASSSSSSSSSSASLSSTTADLNSPPSASSLPSSPDAASPSRSPSPQPPNPRRTLTIVTRANGKRTHRSAATLRRQSAAVSSNSTTYMTVDEFIGYFRRSASLSEAVKRITRSYPSYREVSIYARARRLECRFDERGRFYQPRKRGKSAVGVRGGRAQNNDDSDSDGAMDKQDGSEQQEGESDEEWQKEEEDAGRNGSRRMQDTRQRRQRKVRRVEREERHQKKNDNKADENGADEDDGSDDDNTAQSDSSSSSGSNSGSSSSSVSSLELGEWSKSSAALAVPQPAAHALGALRLLAASADVSQLHSSSFAAKSNGEHRATTSHSLTPSTTSTSLKPSTAAVRTSSNTAAVSRSAAVLAAAPSLALHPTSGSSLSRRSFCSSLPAAAASSPSFSFPFRSSPASTSSAGYGQSPLSSGQSPLSSGPRPVFGPLSSCAFPARVPSYLSTPYLSPAALPGMSLWPPLSSVHNAPLATASALSNPHLMSTARSQQPRAQLATLTTSQQPIASNSSTTTHNGGQVTSAN